MHPTEEKYTSKEAPPGFSTTSGKQQEFPLNLLHEKFHLSVKGYILG